MFLGNRSPDGQAMRWLLWLFWVNWLCYNGFDCIIFITCNCMVLHMLCFLRNITLLHFFRNTIFTSLHSLSFLIIKWCRWLKSYLVEDKDLTVLHGQYQSCWCPSSAWSQGISSQKISFRNTFSCSLGCFIGKVTGWGYPSRWCSTISSFSRFDLNDLQNFNLSEWFRRQTHTYILCINW